MTDARLSKRDDTPIKIGSLFSGIGGLDLAVEHVTGGRVAWHAEIDPFCRAVLARHWPGVPCFERVQDVGAGAAPVTVICGGFPCQDVSQAGKKAGLAGERSGLWSEYARVVCELRPAIVFVENVSGLLVRGFGGVLGDLAAIGFNAEWSCLRASDVGAPHLRRRVFLLAARSSLSDAERDALRIIGQRVRQQREQSRAPVARAHGGDVANDHDDGRKQRRAAHDDHGHHAQRIHDLGRHSWPPGPDALAETWRRWTLAGGPKPSVCRGAYGLSAGLDLRSGGRLRRKSIKALGNAVVPQQAAVALCELWARLFFDA